jgi:hypothetical protein
MKMLAATLASLCLIAAPSVRADQAKAVTPDDIRMVAPALDRYAQGPIDDL